MSRNVLRPIDSSLGSGWATLYPLLMLLMACDFEYVFAQTMISFDEKYPCVTLTTSSPYLSCAENNDKLIIGLRQALLSSPWLRYPVSLVQCRFSFANLQYFWLTAHSFLSNLPDKKDPLLSQSNSKKSVLSEERWFRDERSNENEWMDEKLTYQRRRSITCWCRRRDARSVWWRNGFLAARVRQSPLTRSMSCASF